MPEDECFERIRRHARGSLDTAVFTYSCSALRAGSRVPGCKQRMLKATPFRGDEDVDEVALAEADSRASLWPFFYHRKPVTWPIGEFDFWPLWHL